MKRQELTRYLEQLLEPGRFRDYCPNGLQVEGRPEVRRLIAGVTANQALLDAAVELDADALLVHHGWFWRGEDGRVTGLRKTRLQTLLKHDINLIAYHLPLDGHPAFGNNAQLASRLGWTPDARFGEQDVGSPHRVVALAGRQHRDQRRDACLGGRAGDRVAVTRVGQRQHELPVGRLRGELPRGREVVAASANGPRAGGLSDSRTARVAAAVNSRAAAV